ncbi:MAG: glycosyltransferase family 2 protein [Demequinaceae bacterium]|nr:glycosyltransferase family 2 protein [Demequinaceae bacterium]
MPFTAKQTLVVVPAFNEEPTVGAVVREIRTTVPGSTILVVDDGSTDDTAGVAARAGALVARLPFNLGVGGAMRVGFDYALRKGFPVVVQVDADGQHDPANIPSMLRELGDTDLVLGARFAGTGDYKLRGPRRWAMRILALVLSRTSHTKLTDTTSGFRASGPRAVALFAKHYPAEYLGDTIESLVIASRAGLRVRQVPVAMRVRASGVSSHRPFKAAIYLGRAAIALTIALAQPSSLYRVSAQR